MKVSNPSKVSLENIRENSGWDVRVQGRGFPANGSQMQAQPRLCKSQTYKRWLQVKVWLHGIESIWFYPARSLESRLQLPPQCGKDEMENHMTVSLLQHNSQRQRNGNRLVISGYMNN